MLAPDFAKAIGIMLVVAGHTIRGLASAGVIDDSGAWGVIDKGIYLFHMPLFFYISGLFYEQTLGKIGYSTLVRKNVIALLAPMAVWSYIQFSLQYAASSDVNNSVSLFHVLTAPFPPRQQFWFLGVLFVLTSFAGLFFKFKNSRGALSAAAIFCIVLIVFMGEDAVAAFRTENHYNSFLVYILIHLPFFILGILLNAQDMSRLRVNSLVCIISFCSALFFYLAYDSQNIWALYYLAAAICVLSLYKLTDNVGKAVSENVSFISRSTAFIGMNSMIIYLAHVILSAAFRIVLLRYGITNPHIHFCGGFLTGLAGPLLLVPVGLKLGQYNSLIARMVLPVRKDRKAKKAETFSKIPGVVVMLGLLVWSIQTAPAMAQTPQNTLPRLHVNGNHLESADGRPVTLRGVSLCSLSWQNAVADIQALASPQSEWNVNVIRLPVQQKEWNRIGATAYIRARLDPAVKACNDNNVYCIIDWHIIEPWNSPETDLKVQRFWSYIAKRYANNPNILYEIYNEPTEPKARTRENWLAWREKAQPWVDVVRRQAPETVILVGNPLWDQMPGFAVKDPFEGQNLMYVLHLYPLWTKERWDHLFGKASETIPIFISEWGWSSHEGNKKPVYYGTKEGFGAPLREYLKDKPQVSWTAWSYDKRCGPAMLGTDQDMGNFVKEWLRFADE